MERIQILSEVYATIYEDSIQGILKSGTGFKGFILDVLGHRKSDQEYLQTEVMHFVDNLAQKCVKNTGEIFDSFKLSTKDMTEMSLVLFTERQFLTQIIVTLHSLISKVQEKSK